MSTQRVSVAALLIAALAVQGCQSSDPLEQQADAFEAAGRNRADMVEAEAISRARAMENQASEIDVNAAQAGGYTEKQLDVRADALRREAAIVKEQGQARAEAVEADGDAKAKALRAR